MQKFIILLVICLLATQANAAQIEHHPVVQEYFPLTVEKSLADVRQIIIEKLDPNSILLPQYTRNEMKQKLENEKDEKLFLHNKQALDSMVKNEKNEELFLYNKQVLDCFTKPDKENQTRCEKIAEQNYHEIFYKKPVPPVPPAFRFHVDSALKLEQAMIRDGSIIVGAKYGYLVHFGYEPRGIKNSEVHLTRYINMARQERENDLWLYETEDISVDNLIMSSDNYKLEKFRSINEYAYKGKSVLATSDYIVRLKKLDDTHTLIDIVPLFPRVLAGTRFETSSREMIYPRFVYDLRPVDIFDGERTELLQYISSFIN